MGTMHHIIKQTIPLFQKTAKSTVFHFNDEILRYRLSESNGCLHRRSVN